MSNEVDSFEPTFADSIESPVRISVLTVPISDADYASDRLWLAGARGVEERASSGRVELRACISDDDDVSRAKIGPFPLGWTINFEEVDDAPEDTWRDFARGVSISPTLELQPAWKAIEPADQGRTVFIEPGAAFGLGDHPTTRLMAAAVETLVRGGDRVLDVGCGTGVLSIVATMLGASEAIAIDTSPAAIESTIDNARRNGVDARVHASTAPVCDIDGQFDLVVANILAPTLVAMADDLRRLTAHGGHLVLSGLLDRGHDHVVEALSPMISIETHVLDGWASVVLRHTG
jgi:ribosomal protein L11 methyltransferase